MAWRSEATAVLRSMGPAVPAQASAAQSSRKAAWCSTTSRLKTTERPVAADLAAASSERTSAVAAAWAVTAAATTWALEAGQAETQGHRRSSVIVQPWEDPDSRARAA